MLKRKSIDGSADADDIDEYFENNSVKKLRLDAGTVAAPTLCFDGSETTGLYEISGDRIGIAVGGVNLVTVSTGNVLVSGDLTLTGDHIIPQTGQISNGSDETIVFGDGTISTYADTVLQSVVTPSDRRAGDPDLFVSLDFMNTPYGKEWVNGDELTAGSGVTKLSDYKVVSTTLYGVVNGDGTSNATLYNGAMSAAFTAGFNGTELSFSFWHKRVDTTTREVFTCSNGTTSERVRAYYLSGNMYFQITSGGTTHLLACMVDSDITNWVHWCYVVGTASNELYIDGVLTTPSSYVNGNASTGYTASASVDELSVLYYSVTGSNHSNAYIADLRISKSAWTQAAVTKIYKASKYIYSIGIQRGIKFNEGGIFINTRDSSTLDVVNDGYVSQQWTPTVIRNNLPILLQNGGSECDHYEEDTSTTAVTGDVSYTTDFFTTTINGVFTFTRTGRMVMMGTVGFFGTGSLAEQMYILAAVPVNFRPGSQKWFSVSVRDNGTYVIGTLRVTTAGDIFITAGARAVNFTGSGATTLDGMSACWEFGN